MQRYSYGEVGTRVDTDNNRESFWQCKIEYGQYVQLDVVSAGVSVHSQFIFPIAMTTCGEIA